MECRSFCYFFSLRTGCLVTGFVFLIEGLLRTILEFLFAVHLFHHLLKVEEPGLQKVVFTDDLEPTVSTAFALFLLYGTFKDKPIFVFSGSIFMMMLMIRSGITVFFWLIPYEGMVYYHGAIMETLVILIYFFFYLNISSYYKELAKRSGSGPFQRMDDREAKTTTSEVAPNVP